MSRGGAYPFGIDPTWHGTRTELQFLNSVKMKLSIVLGARPACACHSTAMHGRDRVKLSCLWCVWGPHFAARRCCAAARVHLHGRGHPAYPHHPVMLPWGACTRPRARPIVSCAAGVRLTGGRHHCAGVIQMDAGILLSFLNQRYFRDALSTYCEFIPQMVFLNGLFGYLSLLIVGKWISGSTADLYHVMIYMFLSPGSGGLKCADGQGGYGCAENEMFPGQGPLQVPPSSAPCAASQGGALPAAAASSAPSSSRGMPAQVLLVLAAVIAVPIMLVPKPLILKKRAAKRAAQLESYGQASATQLVVWRCRAALPTCSWDWAGSLGLPRLGH